MHLLKRIKMILSVFYYRKCTKTVKNTENCRNNKQPIGSFQLVHTWMNLYAT